MSFCIHAHGFVYLSVCLSEKGNVIETSCGCKCLPVKLSELENKRVALPSGLTESTRNGSFSVK